MSKYIVDSSLMTGIADNIRLKTGEEGNLVFPTGFNAAIESLPSIEDMRDIKDKVDDIKDIFDSNETEIDKTITTPVDIASFSDGADDLPMALKVAVDPVQDLHGYDNPWPEGGGKNRFKNTATTATSNGVTFTVNSDGSVSCSGTATGTFSFTLGSYTVGASDEILNGCPSGGGGSSYLLRFVASITYSDTGSGTTIPANASGGVVIYVVSGQNMNGKNFYPMIRLSSVTDATFAPYSNICPISGWTVAKVWDDPVYAGTIRLNQIFPLKNGEYAGTNFTASFDGAGCLTVDVTETASATNANNFSSIGAGTWIKGHIYAYIGGAHGINIRLKNFGKDIDSVFRVDNPLYNNIAIVFTNLAVGVYKVYPMIIDLTAMFGEAKAEEILSLGSVVGVEYVKSLLPKEYYPYNVDGTETCISAANGNPYRHIEVTFPSSAGTVYGATLTINRDGTGMLLVDHAEVDLGTLVWNITGDRFLVAQKLDPNPISRAGWYADDPIAICSQYKYGNINNGNGVDKAIGFYAGYLYARDTAYSTSADFKTAMSGVQLVYELATPVTYELTNLEVIETLKGINNIWSDTGKINEAEYSADSQLCITNKLNELDSLLSTYTETQV